MTMVPAQNLSKQEQGQQHQQNQEPAGYRSYGLCGASYIGLMSRLQGYELYGEADLLGSDQILANNNSNSVKLYPNMAEDESRTDSLNEAGSSSRDVQEERDKGWLQLSIGGGNTTATTGTTNIDSMHRDHNHPHQEIDPPGLGRRGGGGGLVELDLLSGSSSTANLSHQATPSSSSMVVPILQGLEFRPPRPVSTYSIFQHQQGSSSSTTPLFPHQYQEINWALRPMSSSSSSSSSPSPSSTFSSSLIPLGPYFSAPFQVHSGMLDVAGPSSDYLRVIDPPRRPHSGIWFMLQASQNQ